MLLDFSISCANANSTWISTSILPNPAATKILFIYHSIRPRPYRKLVPTGPRKRYRLDSNARLRSFIALGTDDDLFCVESCNGLSTFKKMRSKKGNPTRLLCIFVSLRMLFIVITTLMRSCTKNLLVEQHACCWHEPSKSFCTTA